jgi:hemolysin activation/secretion protein
MYQFVTTDHLSQYQVHAFEYRIPTPARHFFEIRGVYSRVNVPIRDVFTQKGENKNLDLRYTIPLQRGTNPIEVWAGLGLKRGNNNLEYVGYGRTYESAADTVQFATGISYVRRDKHGAWALGGTLNMSPGNVTDRNDQATYTQARYGSTPRYVYGTVSAQRQQTLKAGWELSSKLIAQLSSSNLLGSEQLPIGGPSSVRGADTNIFAGDEGFTFSTDLLSPAWSVGLDKISKRAGTLESRFVVFYDAGQVFNNTRYWFDPKMRPLASVGAGVRMSVSNNLSLVFDYGWLVTDRPNPAAARSRGTLKVTLAY